MRTAGSRSPGIKSPKTRKKAISRRREDGGTSEPEAVYVTLAARSGAVDGIGSSNLGGRGVIMTYRRPSLLYGQHGPGFVNQSVTALNQGVITYIL
jgi:hypothetical protein